MYDTELWLILTISVGAFLVNKLSIDSALTHERNLRGLDSHVLFENPTVVHIARFALGVAKDI